ncbi:hypothetical protein [Streptomyces sp. H39-C1]|uniref:hypothetical protein n=1 Tax=Streptomyces sp. H39-C1 TaxID=3004355 RepID=UPI0022AEFAA9|nr:hypothetical protein [Streptomyces sp. H39-C1]MCZ4103713.1 hypothetical protein [Streptomyces sp. H39-C1]
MADLCRSCATTTTYSAAVPELVVTPTHQINSAPYEAASLDEGSESPEEHLWWAEGPEL